MNPSQDGRLKTMLQSVDTARFRDDCPADRLTDISHARSEILSAMLFGYEIVIPAGAIADCPALIELIPEVFEDAEQYLQEINEKMKSRYRLFRIGLEDKYVEQKGRTGYSAFISDYLASKLPSAPDLVALNDLAERNADDSGYVTALLGQAYLERNWAAMEALGDRIARATGDDSHRATLHHYCKYAQCVHKYLEGGEHSRLAARELFSDTSFISELPEDYYYRNLSTLVDVSQERLGANKTLAEQKKAVDRVFRELRANNLKTAERGSWYRYEDTFRNEGMWDYVRNWLDFSLYDKLRDGFAVTVPSYFSQELDSGSMAAQMTLSVLSAQSLARFCQDYKKSKAPEIEHPETVEIDWSAIWKLIADKDYQTSVNSMQARFRDAMAEQWLQLRQLGAEPATPDKQRIASIVRERRATMIAAFDDHVAFLNEKFTNFKLANRDGKIVVRRQQRISAKKATKTVLGTLTGVGEIGSPIIDPIVDKLAEKVSDNMVETTWRSDVDTPTRVDVVSRPANIAVRDRDSFLAAERARLNFWISI